MQGIRVHLRQVQGPLARGQAPGEAHRDMHVPAAQGVTAPLTSFENTAYPCAHLRWVAKNFKPYLFIYK